VVVSSVVVDVEVGLVVVGTPVVVVVVDVVGSDVDVGCDVVSVVVSVAVSVVVAVESPQPVNHAQVASPKISR